MLSMLHPEILLHLQGFDYGLMPIYLQEEQRYILIMKCTKEGILAANINNEFRIYLIRDPDQKALCLGIVTAFFDDHDEPLTILTPLFSNDSMLDDIKSLLSQEQFEVYFFDENNFEMLSANAVNTDFIRLKKDIGALSFSTFQQNKILDIWQKFNKQFSIRTNEDDIASYKIGINDRINPSDVMIADLREKFFGFNDGR